jgi:hypothetical protein
MPLHARRAEAARTSRSIAAAAAVLFVFIGLAASPAEAEGPLYAVPSEPPPVKESVDFTNDLNHRVRHLPAPLNPPVAETPAQVEARIRVLERGVVIEGGAKKAEAQRDGQVGENRSVAAGDRESARGQGASAVSSAPAPLSIAFVGAGVLALLGLLLGALGRQHSRPRQA